MWATDVARFGTLCDPGHMAVGTVAERVDRMGTHVGDLFVAGGAELVALELGLALE